MTRLAREQPIDRGIADQCRDQPIMLLFLQTVLLEYINFGINFCSFINAYSHALLCWHHACYLLCLKLCWHNRRVPTSIC